MTKVIGFVRGRAVQRGAAARTSRTLILSRRRTVCIAYVQRAGAGWGGV